MSGPEAEAAERAARIAGHRAGLALAAALAADAPPAPGPVVTGPAWHAARAVRSAWLAAAADAAAGTVAGVAAATAASLAVAERHAVGA